MVGFICSLVKIELTDLSKYGGDPTPLPSSSNSPDTGTQTFAISLMSDGIDSYHKVELHIQLHTNIHKNKNNIVAYDFLLPDLFLLFLHLLFTI